MDEIEVIQIPREMIGDMLPHLGEHLLRGASAEAEPVNVRDVVDAIVDGSMQLWAVMKPDEIFAAFLTRFGEDDRGLVLDVGTLAGAHILKWGKLISDRMERFARINGADRVVFSGRKGLLKAYRGARIIGERAPGLYSFEGDVSP